MLEPNKCPLLLQHLECAHNIYIFQFNLFSIYMCPSVLLLKETIYVTFFLGRWKHHNSVQFSLDHYVHKAKRKVSPSNHTLQCISIFISVEIATNTTSSEYHLILGQRSCFVSQNVLNLSQVLTYRCTVKYNKHH